MLTSIHMGPQMLPRSKKNDKYKKDIIDRIATIGKSQIQQNAKLLENYQMIRGVFITEHYITSPGISDMINTLTDSMNMPTYLRHFDIIATTINTMSGEWQDHPDNFSVRRIDLFASNRYLRTKKQMLDQFVMEQIQIGIMQQLIESGVDVTGNQIKDPQEKEAYLQALEQQKQAMAPPEIEKYMRYTYSDVAEIWANTRLLRNKEKFSHKLMERTEIEDLFTASKCFRCHTLTPSGPREDTWNPVNTFYIIAPDVAQIEKGEMVGRMYYGTKSDVIGRFGYRLSKKILEELDDADNLSSSTSLQSTSPYGIPYGATIPFLHYPEHKMLVDNLGFDPSVELSDDLFSSLFAKRRVIDYTTKGFYEIIECYFRSKEKIGKVTYISPETGMKVSDYVSEDFVVPDGFKQYSKAQADLKPYEELNSVIWTYQDRICDGFRITGSGLTEPIYIGGEPLEYEFAASDNPFELLLPVVGLLWNCRNADGASLVDLMKSDQIGHNIAMNQAYQLMQKELGKFLLLDPRMMPNFKDWGGEEGWYKFCEVAKELGVSFQDSSPEKLKGANSGNTFPRVIDLDETQRILGRFAMAERFEMAAKRRTGMSPQREGDVGQNETATGIEQGNNGSYNQTRSYFTDFSDYVKRNKKHALGIWQYYESKNDSILLQTMQGEEERAFIELSGSDLSWAVWDLYVSDNAEDLRKHNLIKSLFMNNPNVTTNSLDIYTVIESKSPAVVKNQLGKSQQQKEKLEQQNIEMQKAATESAERTAQAALAWEKEKHYTKLHSEEKQEYIRTFGGKNGSPTDDSNSDGTFDILQYEKLNQDWAYKEKMLEITKQKSALESKKANDDMVKHKDNVNLQKMKIKSNELLGKLKLKIAKVNPG